MLLENLIQKLIQGGYLKTPLIIEAFKKIDRADFVPEEIKQDAYLNAALPIGYGQTISQPLTVAFMLELLQPKPGEKILDVGTGSGWKAALLAYIVSEQNQKSKIPCLPAGRKNQNLGTIISIERIPELKEMAEKNIAKYNFIDPVRSRSPQGDRSHSPKARAASNGVEKGVVKCLLGDGSKGAPKEFFPVGGFDKIIAGAAGDEIPQIWKNQLKIGGRIVAPIKNSIWTFDKISEDKFNEKEYYGFSFVPLITQ